MDTFLEMQTALLSDVNASNTSSFYPTATIQLALNRAYRKVGGLFRWPALEDAKVTSTQASQEYYDAPSTWRPDSIWKLQVDDVYYGEDPDFSPMVFQDYLDWKDNDLNEGSTDKKWAVQHLRYFMYPTPTVAGSNNISVWGQKNVVAMTVDGSVTIFSYNSPECNEAIVLEASAILKKKGELDKPGEMLSMEAKQILIVAFNKIRQEQTKYEKTQPLFYVSDMFGRAKTSDIIGNFT